jgi:hypothetical protein
MAGDLEDFLRRAAARRQEKEQQQRAQRRPPRRQPEYTDSRRERVVRQPEDDEPVLVAELVDEPDPLTKQREAIAKAKRLAAEMEAQAAKRQKKPGKQTAGSESQPPALLSGNLRADILQLIRQPGGLKRAMLLREILDRPEHRW